ncbi:discoidin domain-containing protein [Spirochaetota bacterium]
MLHTNLNRSLFIQGLKTRSIVFFMVMFSFVLSVSISVNCSIDQGAMPKYNEYQQDLRGAKGPGDIRLTRELGVKTVRMFWWAEFWAPQKGVYNWQYEDHVKWDGQYKPYGNDPMIEKIYDYDGEVFLCMERLPEWLRGYNMNIPNNYDDWEEMLRTGLNHVKSRWPNIQYFETHNEPAPVHVDHGQYQRYYERFHRFFQNYNATLPAGVPKFKIIGPAIASRPIQEMVYVLEEGILKVIKNKNLDPSLFAGASFHAFGANATPKFMRDGINAFTAKMAKYNMVRPVWVDAYGRYHGADYGFFHPMKPECKPYDQNMNFNPYQITRFGVNLIASYYGFLEANNDVKPFFFFYNAYNGPEKSILVPDDYDRYADGKTTPVYNAVKMYTMLKAKRIKAISDGLDGNLEGVGCIASKDNTGIALLVYNTTTANKSISFTVNNIPSGLMNTPLRYTRYLVDDTHGNYYYNKNNHVLPAVDNKTVTLSSSYSASISLRSYGTTLIVLSDTDAPTPGPGTATPTPKPTSEATNTPVPTGEPSGNLVVNPGFEEGAVKWNNILRSCCSISANALSGVKAVKIAIGADTYNNVNQYVPINANEEYSIQVWIKAEGITSGCGRLYAEWYTDYKWEGGIRLDKIDQGLVTGNTVYTKVTATATAPSAAKYLILYMSTKPGTGFAYFDDAYVSSGAMVSPTATQVATATSTPVPTATPTDQGTDPVKLSGTVYGYGDPYLPGREYDNVFDSDIHTYFDCKDPSSGYAGIGLSADAELTKIRFYPRMDPRDRRARMIGGKFQGSTDGSMYTDIYTVNTFPDATWNEVTVASSAYRYFRYIGPADGYCNIAEIEFWGVIGGVDPTSTPEVSTSTPTPIPTNTPTPTNDPVTGELISPVSIAYVSSELTIYDRYAENVINGSGIYDYPVTESSMHSSVSTDMWITEEETFGVIAFDLGKKCDLSKILIWNSCEPGKEDRGAGTIDIFVSPDSSYASASWIKITTAYCSPGIGNAESFALACDNVRLVKLDIKNNLGSSIFVGLAEVMFAESSAIPTPVPTFTPTATPPSEPVKLAISSVSASQAPHVAGVTIDGDYLTRWAVLGDPVSITYDLGAVKTVSEVHVQWYKGDRRAFFFDIGLSENGSVFQNAYSGQSSGSSIQFEKYASEGSARYIRIVGHGNTVDADPWTSISEVEIYGIEGSTSAAVNMQNDMSLEGISEQGSNNEITGLCSKKIFSIARDRKVDLKINTMDMNIDIHDTIILNIFTVNGKMIRRHSTHGDASTILWDLRNDSGGTVRSGIYIYSIQTGSRERNILSKGALIILE